jgi:hypothetical protein
MSGVFDRPLRAHVMNAAGTLGEPCMLFAVDVPTSKVVIGLSAGEVEIRSLDDVRHDYRYSEEDHEFHDLLEFGPDGKLLPPPGMKDDDVGYGQLGEDDSV